MEVYKFSIIYYKEIDNSDDTIPLMTFDMKPNIDTKLLSRWESGLYDFEAKRRIESLSDPWTGDMFHPTLITRLEGSVPDFIKPLFNGVSTGGKLLFASMRAIAIMRKHGVNMDAFPASVQFAEDQPPMSDKFMIYRLLDEGPVIDFEKTEIRKEDLGINFRNPVLANTFLKSDSVMMRDEIERNYIFIKQPLKEDLENAGLLGCDFTPFDHVGFLRWKSKFDQPVQQLPPAEDSKYHTFDLPADIIQERERGKQAAARNLGLALDADPKTLVEASARAVEVLARQNLSVEDRLAQATDYGYLYGEQFVRQYGWVWRMVKKSGEEREAAVAVLPPDYAYAMYPTEYVPHFLLMFARNIQMNTMTLWFNQIGEDKMPPRQKNGFRTLFS